jgi:hypothetical protein
MQQHSLLHKRDFMQNQSAIESPESIIAVLSRGCAIPPCAWCLAEQGLAPGEGSHGICEAHANEFLVQWKLRRKRKQETVTPCLS